LHVAKLVGCTIATSASRNYFPLHLVSIGAIAPSIEQYAGALLPLTHLGAARLTPATGAPIAEAEMVVPSRSLVQSSAEITLAASAAGA